MIIQLIQPQCCTVNKNQTKIQYCIHTKLICFQSKIVILTQCTVQHNVGVHNISTAPEGTVYIRLRHDINYVINPQSVLVGLFSL